MGRNEEQHKEMQRRVLSTESEFDKQKALLDQKIQFLEKSIEDYQRKEKTQIQEMQKQKQELLDILKDGSSKYDSQLKSLQDKNEDISETLLEKEAEL